MLYSRWPVQSVAVSERSNVFSEWKQHNVHLCSWNLHWNILRQWVGVVQNNCKTPSGFSASGKKPEWVAPSNVQWSQMFPVSIATITKHCTRLSWIAVLPVWWHLPTISLNAAELSKPIAWKSPKMTFVLWRHGQRNRLSNYYLLLNFYQGSGHYCFP